MESTFRKYDAKQVAAACGECLIRRGERIERERAKAIQKELSRKPFLFIFNKPAKTIEEAIERLQWSDETRGFSEWDLIDWSGSAWVDIVEQIKAQAEYKGPDDVIYLSKEDAYLLKDFLST